MSARTHMGDYLGELEQLVLLALARLGDSAYGVTMRETSIERTGGDLRRSHRHARPL